MVGDVANPPKGDQIAASIQHKVHLNSLLDKVLERSTFLSRKSIGISTASVGTMTDNSVYGVGASSAAGAVIQEETESQEATQQSEDENNNYQSLEESKGGLTPASVKN